MWIEFQRLPRPLDHLRQNCPSPPGSGPYGPAAGPGRVRAGRIDPWNPLTEASMSKPSATGFALIVLMSSAGIAAAGPPGGWDAWIPDTATAVLKIDVAGLNSTPLASREGWGRRHTAGAPADVTSLPDGVTALIAATDLSPRTLDDTWRVSLLDLATPLSAADLVARQGGRIDTVRGQTVVVTPRNLLLVPIDPTHVAARQPADRQALARWVAAGRAGGGGRPSDYLLRAL